MPPDNISLNKAAIIERCLRRMREEYEADPTLSNYTHQDALVLNIERACQAAIDLATHTVADKKLGIPQSSADAFRILSQNSIIENELTDRLIGMTGFRNIAIHQYQNIDPAIIHYIMDEGYRDLIELCLNLHLKIDPDSGFAAVTRLRIATPRQASDG